MPNTPLSQIATLLDKCPVAEIQGKINAVYPADVTAAGKPKQNFTIIDASGVSVKCTAWEHPDLGIYKDRDVVIRPGAKGGLTVNVYNGKAGLSISRSCTFQYLEVHHAQNGVQPKEPTAAAHATPPPYHAPAINGMKVGMAINNACQSLTAAGQPLTKKAIWEIASKIVRVSDYLEAGNLDPATKPSDPKDKKEEPF